MPSFVTPLLKAAELNSRAADAAKSFRLQNTRNHQIVGTHLMPAFDSASRRTGLLAHDAMPPGAAMIIAPCNAVHTIRMRFPIDVAFVAKDGRVLKVRHAVGPWRMTAALRAFAVVELAAGVLTRTDTRPGDTLVVTESNSESG